jgi:RNA polymerase sigma-70 factor, ECF subfamily
MSQVAGEGELLRRAGRGDEAAFLLIYERHRAPVFRFACRMLGSSPLAEDVTQECFLSILKRPEGFQEGRASLRTYLCAIVRHLAFRQLRRQGHEAELEDAPEEAPGAEPSKDALRTVIDEEAAEAVREAVQALPALQREAVLLFEYEALSLAEIAAVCDTDVGTVKSRLHRARERLRKTLAPFLAGANPAVPGRKETRP